MRKKMILYKHCKMMNRKAIVSLIGMNTGDYCNKGVHVLLQLTPDACVMET